MFDGLLAALSIHFRSLGRDLVQPMENVQRVLFSNFKLESNDPIGSLLHLAKVVHWCRVISRGALMRAIHGFFKVYVFDTAETNNYFSNSPSTKNTQFKNGLDHLVNERHNYTFIF